MVGHGRGKVSSVLGSGQVTRGRLSKVPLARARGRGLEEGERAEGGAAQRRGLISNSGGGPPAEGRGREAGATGGDRETLHGLDREGARDLARLATPDASVRANRKYRVRHGGIWLPLELVARVDAFLRRLRHDASRTQAAGFLIERGLKGAEGVRTLPKRWAKGRGRPREEG